MRHNGTKGSEIKESENLKKLFEKVSNRAAFAREWKVPGGASMIYQHINGLKPISLESALIYSKAFDVTLESISPRLSEIHKKMLEVKSPLTEVNSVNLNNPDICENELYYDLVESNENWVAQLTKEINQLPRHEQAAVKNTMTALVRSLQK